MDRWRKIQQLVSLARWNPAELHHRLEILVERALEWLAPRRISYSPCPWEDFLTAIGRDLGVNLEECVTEDDCANVEREVLGVLERIGRTGPWDLSHNADLRLARFCYSVCRAVKPQVVVETDVAYGTTSAFVLAALAVNGFGTLHSVDLPPLSRNGHCRAQGALVPPRLTSR